MRPLYMSLLLLVASIGLVRCTLLDLGAAWPRPPARSLHPPRGGHTSRDEGPRPLPAPPSSAGAGGSPDASSPPPCWRGRCGRPLTPSHAWWFCRSHRPRPALREELPLPPRIATPASLLLSSSSRSRHGALPGGSDRPWRRPSPPAGPRCAHGGALCTRVNVPLLPPPYRHCHNQPATHPPAVLTLPAPARRAAPAGLAVAPAIACRLPNRSPPRHCATPPRGNRPAGRPGGFPPGGRGWGLVGGARTRPALPLHFCLRLRHRLRLRLRLSPLRRRAGRAGMAVGAATAPAARRGRCCRRGGTPARWRCAVHLPGRPRRGGSGCGGW